MTRSTSRSGRWGVRAGSAVAAALALLLTVGQPVQAATPAGGSAPGTPTGLQVDGWPGDGVVGQQSPTLSWQVTDRDRGDRQSAYQVQVTDGGGRTLWDSGRTTSEQSAQVRYGGPALHSDATYGWRVRVWDLGGSASDWSPPARFSTGLLHPADWSASWLETGEGALVRHDLTIAKPVARAWLYVAAQGVFEPRLDGTIIGDHVRDSTWTDWNARTLYRSFDLTKRLQPGAHTLGAMLSQGGIRFGTEPVRFVAQLAVHYADGTSETIGTGTGWRTSAGPVSVADPSLGEQYDARREQDGWDRPGFDDAGWEPARVAAPVVSTTPNLAAGRPVTAKDSTECCGWSTPALVDGLERSGDGSQGYHSAAGTGPDDTKWVQVDLGAARRFGAVTLFPARPTNDPAGDNPGAGFPVRYKVEASDDPGFATATTIADRTDADQPNPGTEAVELGTSTTARYLRVTATKLRELNGAWSFRLAELTVRGDLDEPVFTFGTLAADPTPPMRVVRTVAPVRTSTPQAGVTQFDFGQNFSGWVRISATAPAGTTAKVFKGEILDDAGRVTTRNIGFSDAEGPRQTEKYTFRGGGRETYEPHFVYSGFRYAEVSGLPAGASVTAEARVVHTDVESAGEFTSSDPLLNKIQGAVRQTQLNNLHGLPEDCPTREKRGWTGDAHGTSAQAMANFAMDEVYRKWLGDVATSQAADGSVAAVAPSTQFPGVYKTDPAWGSAYPTVTWEHWQRYGDVSVLREHYDGIRRWVDYLATIADADHVVVRPPVSYGADWQALESTPPAYFHTGFYYRDARVVADMAAVLGKPGDAARYAGLATEIAAGLNKRFYDGTTGTYANGSQFAQAFPLTLGIVPGDGAQKVLDGLVLDIAEHGFHLTTGFVGTQPVFRALDAYGRNDIALRIAERDDYPSFGYMVKQGPGTIWEKWPDSRVGDGTSSKDHIGLGGAIGEWFYTGLAGIEPRSPGYRTFDLSPSPVGDLASASGRVSTPYGSIVSDWRRRQDRFEYRATVPTGTTASVTIPLTGGPGSEVRERGRTVFAGGAAGTPVDGLTVLGSSDTSVTLRAESGSYLFDVRPAGAASTGLSVVSSPKVAVGNGGTAALTAVVTSTSNRAGTGQISVQAPAGMQATAVPSSFALTATNQPTATRIGIEVAVSADVAPGDYPVTVTATAPGADPVSTTSTVHVARTVKEWTFDTDGDAEGWQGANQVTAPVVSGGELRTTATGGDPFLVHPGPLDVDAAAGVVVEVTLTASLNGAGQLFWTTVGGPGFNEGQSGRFSLTAGQRRTYTVTIPAGAGTVSSLRLDPQDGAGPIAIDGIRLLV